jgi:hypothetical protein
MVREIRLEDDVMDAHKEKIEKLKRMEEAISSQPSAVSEGAFSSQHSAFSEKQNQDQNLFTTEGTEGTEEEKGLPRMDADERGSKEQTLPGINTDETDKDREPGRILPQSLGAEVYANRGQIAEPHANLG